VKRRTLLTGGAGAALTLPGIAQVFAHSRDAQWRSLFDGHTLDGWRFFQKDMSTMDRDRVISIERGVLRFLGARYRGDGAAPGHISTLDEHGDYHLRLRYRWGEARFAPRKFQRRNSGILYHMGAATDRLFPPGVEFQVEEGDVGDAIMIDTLALQGPLLGGTPLWPNYFPSLPQDYAEPVRAGGIARQWFRHSGAFASLDGWNTLDLIAFGDQAAHLVNGRIVNTLFKMSVAGADGARVPLTRGRIALEFEHAEIAFSDIAIRALSIDDIAALRKQGSY
jgi:hypothetical protein